MSPHGPQQAWMTVGITVVYKTEEASINSGEVGALPEVLRTLASHALVYCQDSSLIDLLELFNWQNISSR